MLEHLLQLRHYLINSAWSYQHSPDFLMQQQQQQQPPPPLPTARVGPWLLAGCSFRPLRGQDFRCSSTGSIPDTALCEVYFTTHTHTMTPTSHVPLASPPPFKPRTPLLLRPLSRWHLSSFFDDDDTPFHLHRHLPNRADSAACARFRLRKKDLCTIHTLQFTHSALTLSLAATSSVLLQMSKSLAGFSHDIQAVAHASSPFSATIASTSILSMTTYPVIGDNTSFSLKRHRAPSSSRTSPVRPTTRSRIT
jgi:hypothetical protein